MMRRLFAGKFQVDFMWNVVSLAVLGLCGIALNVLVGVYYDAAALGVFNQVFAAFIVVSQFAVGGLHYSVMKFVAQHTEPATRAAVIVGAIVPATILSLAFSTAFWFSRDAVGALLQSPSVATGMAWATPGLFLFALDKVLLGVLNGLRHMRLYALLQALRPVLMIAAFAIACISNCPAARLPFIFSAAELPVFIVAAASLVRSVAGPWPDLRAWIGRHLSFGIRSFASGVLVELNTRIDVLMLGYFRNDQVVGIFSFAAIIAEGIYQLLVVLRNNYNPVIVQLLHAGDTRLIRRTILRGQYGAWAMMLIVGVAAVALYPLGVRWVSHGDEFMKSWPLFAIIMAGIVLSAGYMPFNQMLLLAGRPGTHSLMMLAVVLFNVLGNGLLIPMFDARGAAFATALSFLFYSLMLVILTRKIPGATL